MPTTKERNTVNTYNRREVLKQLKDSEVALMGAIKTYEEQVATWRETAPKDFAAFVRGWDPANGFYKGDMEKWAPPKLSPLCQDWRIQNLNKAIARITAMPEDNNGNIKLYRQDPVFDMFAYASCL